MAVYEIISPKIILISDKSTKEPCGQLTSIASVAVGCVDDVIVSPVPAGISVIDGETVTFASLPSYEALMLYSFSVVFMISKYKVNEP